MSRALNLIKNFEAAERVLLERTKNLNRFREAQEPVSKDDYQDVVFSYLSIYDLHTSPLFQEIEKAIKLNITDKTPSITIEASVSTLSLDQLKKFYTKIKKEQSL